MMNQAYGRDVYQKTQVTAAPQKKLIIMLYDGAIKNLKLAVMAMNAKEIERTNTLLIKAQNIISEFMITLDFEKGGDIAPSLYSLYDYMYNSLIRANIDKDTDKVEEVIKYLEELRDTWNQI